MTDNTDKIPNGPSSAKSAGPFLAKIVSHLDPTYMGMLEVEILRPVGSNPRSEGQLHQVKMITPFYGTTSVDYTGSQDDYNNTQKSYGMWFIPPDVGTTVVIIFIDGDPKRGFWIGCALDDGVNFMVPGIAATQYAVPVNGKSPGRVPVAEYNKKVNDVISDVTKVNKPLHPLAAAMRAQGLILDDIRGITTSSARREVPSAVFGISTPGPIDKQSGAKQGIVGKLEHQIPNAFVSRLGGSTFVMDDGDDKFIRKTPAGSGPPIYAAVEQQQSGGNVTIPHNELIRFRTRTGHQILFHNSEDLIYIGNARGTSWIELTSNGKIDIFAEDSISVHTKQDINFRADRDINFEATRNINLKAGARIQTEAGTDYNILVGANGQITTKGSFNINTTGNNNFTTAATTNILSGGQLIATASQIHMNGPGAASATTVTALSTFKMPDEAGSTLDSIMLRVPTHEPWPHHENLNPLIFLPAYTDRDLKEAKPAPIPPSYKQYTTSTDTFSKVKGSN